jgi:hypothetical protein
VQQKGVRLHHHEVGRDQTRARGQRIMKRLRHRQVIGMRRDDRRIPGGGVDKQFSHAGDFLTSQQGQGRAR